MEIEGTRKKWKKESKYMDFIAFIFYCNDWSSAHNELNHCNEAYAGA